MIDNQELPIGFTMELAMHMVDNRDERSMRTWKK